MTSLITQGQRELNRGLWSMALETFERAISLDGTDLAAWEGKTAALKNLGRWAEAVEVEEWLVEVRSQAIVVDSETLAGKWFNSALEKAMQGDMLRAIQDWEKAIEIKPDYGGAYYNRACSYSFQGDFDRAISDLAEAIRLEPEHYRKLAETNSDFELLREDSRFLRMLN